MLWLSHFDVPFKSVERLFIRQHHSAPLLELNLVLLKGIFFGMLNGIKEGLSYMPLKFRYSEI